jgi:hypothetical protein
MAGSLHPSRRRIRDRTTGKLRPLTDDEAQSLEKESAAWFRELRDAGMLPKLLLASPGFEKGQEIAVRLIAGALDLLTGQRRDDSINPFEVGVFLANLSTFKLDDRFRIIDRWLNWFGIDRVAKVGRPKGKGKAEREHFLWFTVYQQVIEKTQVWSGKQELKRRYPRSWKNLLREVLHKDKCWKPKKIDFIISSKTAHTLALNLAANQLGIDPDTVARSVRRLSRSRS